MSVKGMCECEGGGRVERRVREGKGGKGRKGREG